MGGYVKMLDEREDDVDESERHRAFNNQPVLSRIAIVAAGPLANFLLAIVTYWAMFMIGISGVAPIVGDVKEGSIAAESGFISEDRITAINGKSVTSWDSVHLALLDESLDQSGDVTVAVDDKYGGKQTRIIATDYSDVLKGDGNIMGYLGLDIWRPVAAPVITGVEKGWPADQAGFIAGDVITAVNGEPVDDWRQFAEKIQIYPNQAVDITLQRDGNLIDKRLVPASVQVGEQKVGRVGVRGGPYSAEDREKIRVVTRFGLLESGVKAVEKAWDISVLTVGMMGKLITGQASLKNISGPVTIAQFAGQSASVGVDHYLNFIAMISISLFILNLLPIPVLDGGHLVYFFYRAYKRFARFRECANCRATNRYFIAGWSDVSGFL